MSKRLGISPKSVERSVLAQVELRGKLWDAVPPRPGENLKAWFPRAASKLGWTARRVRAFWNGEVRRIDYAEIVTLNQRIEALKAAEARHQEHADDIRRTLESGSATFVVESGPAQPGRDALATDRGMVPRQNE